MKREKRFYGWEQLPVLLTPQEAACVLRVTEAFVRGLLRDGRLPGVKVGKIWRIERDRLRAYAEGRGAA